MRMMESGSGTGAESAVIDAQILVVSEVSWLASLVAVRVSFNVTGALLLEEPESLNNPRYVTV